MTIKMKNIISITEARKEIFDIAEKVQKVGNHYLFTENGKAKMAIMSADEYENLMEDLVLAADPKFAAKIKKSEEELASGNYVTLQEFEKELGIVRPAQNLVLRDKAKKGYKVNKRKK
jgi:prevent-host-death family protein